MDSAVSGTMVPAPLTSASSSMKNPLFADTKKGAEILQHASFFTASLRPHRKTFNTGKTTSHHSNQEERKEEDNKEGKKEKKIKE